MSDQNSSKKDGFSLEELWFHEHNQKLIEKLRQKKADPTAESTARPKLTLIQGGKQEAAPALPEKPAKKAA